MGMRAFGEPNPANRVPLPPRGIRILIGSIISDYKNIKMCK
jgi:hypothetical protein